MIMQATLPQDKLDAAIALVNSFKPRKKVHSYIETLQFAAKVVVSGAHFYVACTV